MDPYPHTTETTALETTPTSVPARRPSRKKNNTYAPIHAIPQPIFTEKYSDSPTSSNPFADMHALPAPRSTADLEAQSTERFKPTPSNKKKGGMCMLILCVFVIWGLFMFGVVLFANTMFPGALEWRHLKVEMVDTEKAVEVLRGKVGEMLRFVDGLGLQDVVGGMRVGGGIGRGNWTMGGVGGSGMAFGYGNGTVGGM